MREIWKPVKNTRGIYQISSFGRLKRAKTGKGFWATSVGKILKPQRHPFGYLMYNICCNGKQKTKFAHRLVLEAFIGFKKGLVCNHKNGNPSDNRLENIEWATQKQNVHHYMFVLKKRIRGERNGMSKLSYEQVLEIKKSRHWHGRQVYFARKFNVSQTAIWYILNSRNWKHIK